MREERELLRLLLEEARLLSLHRRSRHSLVGQQAVLRRTEDFFRFASAMHEALALAAFFAAACGWMGVR